MSTRAVRTVVFAAIWCIAGVAGAATQESFDSEVTAARRAMRASCQAVQGIGAAAEERRPVLAERAATEAGRALELWTGILSRYGTAKPDGYAGDPGWKQRLEDVRLDLVAMRRAIAAGEYRSAFLACAHACSLLAAMHEANGVTLPIDVMARLRKEVKLVQGLLAAGERAAAGARLAAVLAARDAVLLTPAPVSGYEAYLEGLDGLSRAVDRLAAESRAGGDLVARLKDLAAMVERVYELAL